MADTFVSFSLAQRVLPKRALRARKPARHIATRKVARAKADPFAYVRDDDHTGVFTLPWFSKRRGKVSIPACGNWLLNFDAGELLAAQILRALRNIDNVAIRHIHAARALELLVEAARAEVTPAAADGRGYTGQRLVINRCLSEFARGVAYLATFHKPASPEDEDAMAEEMRRLVNEPGCEVKVFALNVGDRIRRRDSSVVLRCTGGNMAPRREDAEFYFVEEGRRDHRRGARPKEHTLTRFDLRDYVSVGGVS